MTDCQIRTERFSWHGHTDSGFTGRIGLRLAGTADATTRRAYSILGTFAGIAGIGRGTTHGLGACTLDLPTNPAARKRESR